MQLVDRRGAAKSVGSLALVTAIAVAAKELGVYPESIAAVLIPAAAASGITSGIVRHPSVDVQLFHLSRLLTREGSETPGLSGMCTPADPQDLKRKLSNDELPSGLVAKYWIVRGEGPRSQSLKSVVQKIQDIEARCYRGLPRLDPGIALRIVGALIELPQDDLDDLARPELQSDWQNRLQALEKAMVEARYYQILAAEQRRLRNGTGEVAGGQKSKENPARYDVPTQGQVAIYFLLTGKVPEPHVSGLAVARATRSMQRDRIAPIDPVAAKHAVFLLLGLENQHDALMPAHNDALRPVASFPYCYTVRPLEEAAQLYDAIMSGPVSILDAFVGRDGWHYVRGPSSTRGHESIVARRGDKAACITDRRDRVEREWGLFKAERCSIPLVLDEDTAIWDEMLRVQLAAQRKQAEGMSDPVEYVWPSKNGTWSEGRQRLQVWADNSLSNKPSARRIPMPRMAVRVGHTTLG